MCDAMTLVLVCYLLMSLVFPLCELPLGEHIKISVTVLHTSKHTHTREHVQPVVSHIRNGRYSARKTSGQSGLS